MKKTARRLAVLAGVAVTLAGSALAPAVVATADDGSARQPRPRTVHVTGEQFSIPGTPHYTMRGDLVGTWYYYPVTPALHDVPSLYSEAGTEVFVGCLNSYHHDDDCDDRRDRGGQMRTTFLYWASFNTERKAGTTTRTTLIRGDCVHPVTGGRGTFRGARGVVDMVDRLEDGVVKTTYSGDIVLNAVSEPAAPEHPSTLPTTSAGGNAAARTAAQGGC